MENIKCKSNTIAEGQQTAPKFHGGGYRKDWDRMLRVYRFSRRTDSPTSGNWRNMKKKIENRNPYITYLENLDALPMSCFILLSVWLFERWHILLNPCIKNVIGINFLFFGMFIVSGFILFYLECYLHRCGDNRKLTNIL